MNFKAINELDNFNFHDAQLHHIDFHDGNMVWKLSSINITRKSSQNNFGKDMCIKDASIVFENVQIEKIVFSAYKIYDANNILIKSEDALIADSNDYSNILKNSLDSYCYIYSMDLLPSIREKTHFVSFNIDGGAGDYDLTLSFSKSIVQWSEYSGQAWYEDLKS